MEQDLLSTLECGLVPFLLLLGRGEGNREGAGSSVNFRVWAGSLSPPTREGRGI